MSEPLHLDVAHAALLLMDFQNDIVGRGGKVTTTDEAALQRIEAAMAAANRAAASARKAGMQVIHIAVGRKSPDHNPYPHAPLFQFMLKANALVEGTHGFDFHPESQPAPGEPVFVKRGISALAGSELGPFLVSQGIQTLVLTGFATHMVVVGTAREAVDAGYRVVVLEDGCASGGTERHDAALENLRMLCTVSDTAAFHAALGG